MGFKDENASEARKIWETCYKCVANNTVKV